MRYSNLKLNDILVQRQGKAANFLAKVVRERIKSLLSGSDIVKVDMLGVKSLSPSFAYNAFGHLYDTFKDKTESLLEFENDESQLSDRIYKAISRRRFIFDASNHSSRGGA